MNTTPLAGTDHIDPPEPPSVGGATIVAGTSFCVSGRSGDIAPDNAQGLFVEDTRLLSTWRLEVDGDRVDPLTVLPGEPFECTFIGRAAPRPERVDPTLVVERRRLVGEGLREEVTLRNFSTEAAGVQLRLDVDADFADLFEVKARRGGRPERVTRRAVGDSLVLWVERAGSRRGVRVSADGAEATPSGLWLRAVVPAQGTWTSTVEVRPSVAEGGAAAEIAPEGLDEAVLAEQRMRSWRAASADVRTANGSLQAALVRTARDLGALRIVDPAYPQDDVVAAGAPWFMALFGRDSLLTSWMALPFAPTLALGTLRTLARLQGTRSDPMTEEEPGKILHEVRLGMDHGLALGGSSVYFGSVDATPLFVVLVDRALRWGAPADEIRALMPAVDAALGWMTSDGDRDGDGFLEYQRRTDRGLLNQGWKDSHDGITFADGRIALAPIALAEVQGYAYAAYRARAHLADVLEAGRGADAWRERAAALQRAFDDAFWLADRGWYAVALDRDKQPVDSLASNMGHCLWSGIVPQHRAPQVADALLSPELFTGFGIRTLSSGAARYNPVGYHTGTVWPHDTTLALSGLVRYGLSGHAERVVGGLLRAAEVFDGRLPELFCGFGADDKAVPVPYPASCSPQAWAAAAPYELLRASLRLDVCVPHGEAHAGPAPAGLAPVRIDGLPVAGSRALLDAEGHGVRVEGLPEGLTFHADGLAPACDALARAEPAPGHG